MSINQSSDSKFWGTSEQTERLVKIQFAGPHPQRFLFLRNFSDMGSLLDNFMYIPHLFGRNL